MGTWNDAEPPSLPRPGAARTAIGAARTAALLLVTLTAALIYLAARLVERPFGSRRGFEAVQTLWCRVALALLGLRLRRIGAPMRERGEIVANHSTWLDIPVIRSSAPVYFVAKSEVAGWPGAGWIARITGTVFIERRRTEAKRQEAELTGRIAAGDLLCVFPEGTSTDGRRVLPFKSSLFGIFYSGALGEADWVQPVSVSYAPDPRSGLPAEFYGWWGPMGFEENIWTLARLSFGGRATIVFHPPVRARDFPDRKALADHCQREVARGVEEQRLTA
jgi:1-acyl-sn-glycerol-3-phosphate acyltransferase